MIISHHHSDRDYDGYLHEVQTSAGGEPAAWLASNLTPETAFDVALKDEFETFLSLRAEHLHRIILAKTKG